MSEDRIAIVGMAGRFPGASDVAELWQMLCEGRDGIREFSSAELDAAGVDAATRAAPNFVNVGAPLDDAAGFDAAFFGYTPREAELLDPQQRIFLESCWHALEDAGYAPEKYRGLVGVFGCVARNTYFLDHADRYLDLYDKGAAYEVTLSTDKDYVATRVAYKLDLRGPSVNVQSACSSSAVATHLAVASLLSGDCDIALAGGARVHVPPTGGYLWVEGGIPSRDGRCRAFDADATGCVYGSGSAVIVLKRLGEAVEDGDSIYAVIAATAINNDGARKAGFTAPSTAGQREVIESALSIAGTDPASVGYVEAHGTGTRIGDPIEIEALTEAYRKHTDKTGYCAVGSLKASIGHLDAGAGVAGLIKAALMLHHGKLVPSANFKTPNPEIDFANSPFYVSTEYRDWPAGSGPRRAAVSAFGLGGTNFHAILEEAPAVAGERRPDAGPVVLPLSAASVESLSEARARLAEFAEGGGIDRLDDVAYTLQVGRADLDYREAIVARSVPEAIAALRRPARPVRATAGLERVAFMFPGQGAQHPNMARGLYESLPAFREQIDRASAILEPLLRDDLRRLIFIDGDVEAAARRLAQTRIAQPALFVVEHALAMLWMDRGVRPDALVGHSLGEYVAATLAGVFSLEDALALVARRGELMQAMPAGRMLAVPLPEHEVQAVLDAELEIATVSGPSLTVVGGETGAVARFADRLRAQGVETKMLDTSHAYHTAMMDGMLEDFSAFMRSLELSEPSLPFVSNVTGDWISPATAADPQYWVRHVRSSVRFASCIETLGRDEDTLLLEVGPGQILSGLARACRPAGCPVVSSLPKAYEQRDEVVFLLERFGELWAQGYSVEWRRTGRGRRRVHLPGYCFEHKPFWLTGGRRRGAAAEPVEAGDRDAGTAPPPGASGVTGERSRPERIAHQIRRILVELSGVTESGLVAEQTFVELGFDSLFLTRAAGEFGRTFGIEVGLRRLIEDTPSIASLSEWLDETLPPEAFAPPVAPPAAADAPALSVEPAREIPGDRSGLTELMQRQIALLNEQIALIQRWSGAGGAVGAAALSSGAGPGAADAGTTGSAVVTGPWRPIAAATDQRTTAAQRALVARLAERLGRRMAGSKEYTARHRSHFADPRAVAGYRQAWKELVHPVVVDRSEGSRIWDIDGNELVDFAMGFGVSLFGHRPEFVTRAVVEQLERGFEIGPTPPLAGETAELICEMTGQERAAFCNTGSEAVLAAIRLARTVTARDKIVFFSNDYHGIFDETLARSFGGGKPRPIAPGIPATAVEQVLVLDYGEPSSLETIREHGAEIAAVIVEPVQSRHPDLQPREFLASLRELTSAAGIALVFDEIITGFRCHPGGAQQVFGVRADIATYGKAIGGGFPIAVVAGSRRFLDALDGGSWSYGDDSYPSVGVTWFAGTFVRHPVALAATRACLEHMRTTGPALQRDLNEATQRLVAELNGICEELGVPIHVETFASLFNIKFLSDQQTAPLFYLCMRDHGIHVTEGRAAFVSTAHTPSDFEMFTRAFRESLRALVDSGWLSSSRRIGLSETAYAELAEALEADRKKLEQRSEARRFWNDTELVGQLEALCSALAAGLLLPTVGPGTVVLRSELVERLGIVAGYQKAVDYMLNLLVVDEVVRAEGRDRFVVRSLPDDPAVIADAVVARRPEYRGLVELLRLCFEHYPAVLCGREHGANVLLPGGDRSFARGFLKDRTAPYRNLEVYESLTPLLLERLKEHGPVRVLEIGGGGGDVTRRLLPLLDESDLYMFSDIGSTFVFDARKSLRDYVDRGILQAAVFDITKAPPAAISDAGPYDLVIGLNVVHATPSVEVALRNLTGVLSDTGIVALIELTRSPRWENLIWGLTAGWWAFDDEHRTDQPLLDIDAWQSAMWQAGFDDVRVIPGDETGREATDAALVLGRRSLPSETARTTGAREPIELTDAQKEILVAAVLDEDANRAFNITSAIEFCEMPDLQRLEAAIASLLQHNPVLGGRITADIATLIPDVPAELPFARATVSAGAVDAIEQRENAEPFDIFAGPLVRFRLLEVDDGRAVLLTTVHHVAADGWSVGNIHLALGRAYREPSTGAESARQFREYAAQGNADRTGTARALAYWKEQLAGYEGELGLPLDRPRPRRRTYAASAERMHLPSELVARLKKQGARQGCTLFTTLLAGYFMLLTRLTRDSDHVVGITAAGQFFSQMPEVIGHCINMLPLRLKASPDTTTSELMRLTRTKTSDAFDHYECTYGRLVQELDVARDPSRPTLISTIFNYDPIGERPNFGALAATPRFVPKAYEMYETFLNVAEQEDGLSVQLVANATLFERTTLRRHLDLYRQCLEHIADGAEGTIGDVRLIDAESEALLRDINSRSVEVDAGATLHGLFERRARETPEAIALVDEDGRVVSYADLDRRADELAARAAARGARRGAIVGLVFERSVEMIVSILGVLKAGAAYLPLDPEYPAERLKFMVDDAGAALLLTHAPCRGVAAALGPDALPVDELPSSPAEELDGAAIEPAGPADAAYVIYTSGSTGAPKGVINEHRHICNYLQAYQKHAKITGSDVALVRTQFTFDVSASEIFLILSGGGRLVLPRAGAERDPDHLAALVERHRVSVLHFVPSLLELFLEGEAIPTKCATLRFVIASGEPLSRDLRERFRERLPGCELRNLYGPSEAAVHVTHCVATDEEFDAPVSIGVPIENNQIWIVDPRMQPVPIGVAGELCIGGAQVARGYLNRETLSAEKFVHDPFRKKGVLYRTGDLARYRGDGRIEHLGRLDDQVKIRGFRVELDEVRSAIEKVPHVVKAAVLRSDGEGAAASLAAFYETDATPVHPGEVVDALRKALPPYMVPGSIVAVERISLLPNGKVDRYGLLSMLVAEEHTDAGAPPETPTETAVARIWSRFLERPVGRDSSFFELGGHSLLAVQVVRECQAELGRRIPIPTLFESPRLCDFAREVDERAPEDRDRDVIVI